MGTPPRKIRGKKIEGGIKVTAAGDRAFPAKIMEVIGSMGTREGGRQVRVKVLSGSDSGKIIRRNVLGPIRIGDILMLKETEIEASP